MAVRERLEDLLQLPDADVLAGKEGRKGGKVGLAVVVRDENLGSDGLGSGDTLIPLLIDPHFSFFHQKTKCRLMR